MPDLAVTTHTASSALLGHAEVGTYGLAHSLLAWARCRLWCDRHGIPMLAPNWLHLQHRIGPFLRREHDNRQYHRLFRFGQQHVTGLRRVAALALRPRVVAEAVDLARVDELPHRSLVVFSNRMKLNEEAHFHEIVGHGRQVNASLLAMTKPQYRPQPDVQPHIAVHVRMGDFGAASSMEALRQGAKNSRIPIEWYVSMVSALREVLGPVGVRVYSDGTDEALAPLLALPDTRRSPRQPSVTDLLSIAQARVVVSSGSGFSMWGAYLGDSPRVCFPGQRFCRVLPQSDGFDLEPECERPGDLDPRFVSHVRSRFGA